MPNFYPKGVQTDIGAKIGSYISVGQLILKDFLFKKKPIENKSAGGIGGVFDLLEAITSSTLNIMQAASVADLIICSLTITGSNTFCINITTVFLTSMPAVAIIVTVCI
jgi:hypothetical protein